MSIFRDSEIAGFPALVVKIDTLVSLMCLIIDTAPIMIKKIEIMKPLES
jgi:hypothetical protein